MCGAKGSKAPFHGKRQVGAAANFCVAANMKGRPSGYRKVAVKVGPAGQTDARLGRAATRASAPTEQAQSSTALERLHSMKVPELRALLSQRGLSNVVPSRTSSSGSQPLPRELRRRHRKNGMLGRFRTVHQRAWTRRLFQWPPLRRAHRWTRL